MSTTVTEHVNGRYFLYEKDGEKVEVNAEDHYLISKGICYINWDMPEIVVRRADKYNEYLAKIRDKKLARYYDGDRVDSLTVDNLPAKI